MNAKSEIQDVKVQILKAAGISRVIYVDDWFSHISGVERVLGRINFFLSKEDTELLQELFPQTDFNLPDQVWRASVEKQWETLDIRARSGLLTDLANASGEMDALANPATATEIGQALEGIVELHTIPPEVWEKNIDKYFSEASSDSIALCIFDRDLSKASGYTDNSGLDLTSSAIEKRRETGKESSIMLGVLTRTISQAEESEKTLEFENVYRLDPEQYMLLSGNATADFSDLLASALKRLALHHLKFLLAREVKNASKEAGDKAEEKLRKISVSDFDDMVMSKSEKEGVWEAETVFRIFEAVRHDVFKGLMFSESKRVEIEEYISKFRNIQKIITPASEQSETGNRVEFRRLELYENADLVNSALSPISLGDLFNVAEHKYVLVAQPCDIALRNNGKRKLSTYTLVKIEENVPETQPRYEMKYFDEAGTTQNALLGKSIQIATDVIDLAAFDKNGRCQFVFNSNPPAIVYRPWKKRFEIISNKFVSANEHYKKLTEVFENSKIDQTTKDFVAKSIIKDLSRCELDVPFQWKNDTIEFEINRFGSLKGAAKTRLINNYISHFARDADDFDLAA